MSTKEGIDPFFTREGMGHTGEMYLGGQDPDQPLLAPAVHADLTGFPPILLQVGTNELLLDDSVRLAERARGGGRRDPRRHSRGAARVPGLHRDVRARSRRLSLARIRRFDGSRPGDAAWLARPLTPPSFSGHGRLPVRAHRYRITIVGRLGVAGQEAVAGFDITPDGLATVQAGELDQAALHGALHRIQALGLELVGVARLG